MHGCISAVRSGSKPATEQPMEQIMAFQPAPFPANTQSFTFGQSRTLHSVKKMQLLDDLEEHKLGAIILRTILVFMKSVSHLALDFHDLAAADHILHFDMGDEESLFGATATNAAQIRQKVEIRQTSTNLLHAMGGYHDIAGMMARFPVTAIFKRFRFLNHLNILYLQAELAILEECITEVAQKDRDSPDREQQKYFQSFRHLSEGRTEGGDRNLDQWQLALRMRAVLKEYNEAILSSSHIAQLEMPSEADIQYIREWMDDNGNGCHTALTSADYGIWDSTPMNDMVALCARAYPDPISTWFTEKAVALYHKKVGKRFTKRAGPPGTAFAKTSVYERKASLRVISIFAVSVASLSPIVSIVVFSELKDSNKLRLGLMSLFTVLFCILCSLFTGAKKTELLAASAAFAAVQVVFISGDNCCSNS